jgi:four helix bundle protein
MNYMEWEKTVPESIQTDSLWEMPVYRCALFLSDLCWQDAGRLMKDRRTIELAGQLYDAVGSIGAGLSMGYSRENGRDRARFYESSLGSARESRHWYFKGRHVLGQGIANHRLHLLAIIVRLTRGLATESTGELLREKCAPYQVARLPDCPPLSACLDVCEPVPLPEEER